MYKKITGLMLAISLLSGCAAVVVGTAATTIIVANDRRTTGTIVEDKSIQLKALHALNQTITDHKKTQVKAISYNNNILLIGQVSSQKMRHEIIEAMYSIEKVRKIYDELVIAPPLSIKQRSQDAFITTKIKSEMALTQNFNPTRVKVITENSIVYLMGIIKKEEETVAVDIARYTKGVKKVVKIFEE